MVDRDPSPLDATDAAPRPTVLAGRYEILGLLGTGGMGRVYRARDGELGEVVALKVLRQELVGSAEMVERFRQEVRLARKVTHRNVARTFDIGEHGGERFLTMELVHGESLAARLERGLLPVAEVITIAREILAGMSAAHGAGIVHRDLKPDNVLLERGGRVVVTDFGIARVEAPDATRQTSGGTAGTPAYMAPEQVRGDDVIDARADVYAFGAVLFEMLTGRRAWTGASAIAVAAARLTEPPPDPRAVRPSLAPQLGAVVLRCLARDRDRRYASCADIERELAAFSIAEVVDAAGATAAPVVAAPASAHERSVAVMPFRNLGAPDDAYFALGLTEDLVDALSTVRGLRVRGRGSVDSADHDVVDTGRRLGVDVVVDGSVRRAGDLLRVSARVIGVADGFQIWSSRFERPAKAAFALNDEVASAIATALSAERDQAPRAQPTDPRAIELYFRARQALTGFWWAGGASDAKELFRQALASAPDDPTILAGYVHAQLGRSLLLTMDPAEASALARRALVAAPRLPDPWIALAVARFNHQDDAPGAMRALRRALELGPSNADAHDRAGRLLLEADVWDEGLAHLDRAIWLDPSQTWARIDRIRAAALVGDWTKAQELCGGGVGTSWNGHVGIHQMRIWSWPGAPEIVFPAVPESARPELHAMSAGYATARERRRTGQVISRDELPPQTLGLAATAPSARGRRFVNQQLAELAGIGGNLPLALEHIGAAVAEGLIDLAWMTRLRLWDPLRGDPTFDAHRRVVEARAASAVRAWRAGPESLDEALASLAT